MSFDNKRDKRDTGSWRGKQEEEVTPLSSKHTLSARPPLHARRCPARPVIKQAWFSVCVCVRVHYLLHICQPASRIGWFSVCVCVVNFYIILIFFAYERCLPCTCWSLDVVFRNLNSTFRNFFCNEEIKFFKLKESCDTLTLFLN